MWKTNKGVTSEWFSPQYDRVRETKVCFSTNVDSNNRAVGKFKNLGVNCNQMTFETKGWRCLVEKNIYTVKL